MDLDDVFLEIERFDVVGHQHEVGLRRELIAGMPPVAVLEDAELAGGDDADQLFLYGSEIARRGLRPRGKALGKPGRFFGIGLGSGNHVDPVQPAELVEVHQVVMVPQGQLHQVADDIRVVGDVDLERVLNGMDGGECVRARADAADAFHKSPYVAGVTVFDDDFQPPEHGPAGDGVGDHVVVVDVHFAPEMPLDARNRVDDKTPPRVVNGVSLRCVFVGHDQFLSEGVESLESVFSACAVLVSLEQSPSLP